MVFSSKICMVLTWNFILKRLRVVGVFSKVCEIFQNKIFFWTPPGTCLWLPLKCLFSEMWVTLNSSFFIKSNCLNSSDVPSCNKKILATIVGQIWPWKLLYQTRNGKWKSNGFVITCKKWFTMWLSKPSPPRWVSPAVVLLQKLLHRYLVPIYQMYHHPDQILKYFSPRRRIFYRARMQ